MSLKIGQRVRLTGRAVAMGLQGRAATSGAVVVSILPPHRYCGPAIRVIRDGLKGRDTYIATFWRPEVAAD